MFQVILQDFSQSYPVALLQGLSHFASQVSYFHIVQ
jgi:hypothetical protein